MLPNQAIKLLETLVRTFDMERPALLEFKKMKTHVRFAKGGAGWGSGDILEIGNHVVAHLEAKSRFIWEQLQDVISSINLSTYPELGNDLKVQVSKHFNPSRKTAEQFLDEIEREARAPRGHTMRAKTAIANILPKLEAEIDLFSANYQTRARNRNQANASNQSINIHNFHGIFGNIHNSQVILYDYSSVNELLVNHKILKQDRREFEDIMDELKDAPPEKKKALLARAEVWIVKHKELLGTGAEAVGRAVGAAVQQSNKP